MVVGGSDTGKTTFARYLFQQACETGMKVAFLDGDPGQSTLGPPTTITIALNDGSTHFPPPGRRWQRFVGSVSPKGHMLPLVVGVSRLVQAAVNAGAETVVYDTSGLVDPTQGGLALKLALVDLLQPAAVFTIQQEDELISFIEPLRRKKGIRLVELQPSDFVQPRDHSIRRQRRAAGFARYFKQAGYLSIYWQQMAVFPTPRFTHNRLLALEDKEGFTQGLGIVVESNRQERAVNLLTPMKSIQGVDALRLGDLKVDPVTFQHELLT